MNILKKLNEARLNLGKKMFPLSLLDLPKQWNLTLEYLDGMPARLDGYLDHHQDPRFIAVNRALPAPELAYIVARELSRCGQSRRLNSFLLCSPKKWKLLEGAPSRTREQLCKLDLEGRTLMMMSLFAPSADNLGFIRLHPKKYLHMLFADNIADLLFLKLRIKNLFFALSWPIRALVSAANMS
jgi:hypothetical protein